MNLKVLRSLVKPAIKKEIGAIGKSAKMSDAEIAKEITKGFHDSRELLTSLYWLDHLMSTGMTKEEAVKDIAEQVVRMDNVARNSPTKIFTNGDTWALANGLGQTDNGGSLFRKVRNLGKPWSVELQVAISRNSPHPRKTAKHEFLHIGNLNGKELWQDVKNFAADFIYNKRTRHNLAYKPKARENAPYSKDMMKYISDPEESRVRALFIHDALRKNNLTIDEFYKLADSGKFTEPRMKGFMDSLLKENEILLMFNGFGRTSLEKYLRNVRAITPFVTLAGGGLLAYNNSEGNYELN